MGASRYELTIEEALADPMIGALMRADRVEAGAFKTFLQDSAASLAARPRLEGQAHDKAMLSLCCAIAKRAMGGEVRPR